MHRLQAGAPALLLLFCTLAEAADRPPILIDRPRDRTYHAAVQRFASQSSRARDVAKEVDADLGAALEFSGLFSLVDRRAFLGPETSAPLSVAGPVRCEGWRQIGSDALVQGELAVSGKDVQVEFLVRDVARGCGVLVRKRYRVDQGKVGRLGKAMADEIVNAFTGRRGVADTEIAFIRTTGPTKEIYVMDANGAGQRAVTRHGSISTLPDWSPDGTSLVYTSYRYRNRPWLFIIARGKQSPGRILRGLDLKQPIYRGVFDPGGARLALVRSVSGASEIFTVGKDGQNLRRLTRHRAIDVSPSWSPDGTQITFVSDRTGSPQVYVMNQDGQNLRRLTYRGSYNTSPTWSPDGRWIAYESREGGGHFDIWLIDPSGRDNVPVVTHRRNDEHPSWSPDSRKLAFSSTRNGRADIYVVDAPTGGNVQRITREGENTGPTWGPYRR